MIAFGARCPGRMRRRDSRRPRWPGPRIHQDRTSPPSAAGRIRFMDARAGCEQPAYTFTRGNVDLDTPGAIVPRRHVHGRSGRCAHGPLALAAIGGELRVGKECLQRRPCSRAPRAARPRRARLPDTSCAPCRQRDLVDHAARDLAFEGALGDVRRQEPRVVHGERAPGKRRTPSALTSVFSSSSFGSVSACHVSQPGKRFTSRSRYFAGGLRKTPSRFQPPSSTGPRSGWSNGYQST